MWREVSQRVRAIAAEQPARTLRRTPVSDCDPYQLGVHRAYLPGEDPALPVYVHRDVIEDELVQTLGEAGNRNGFILLLGESGAGKTRLAYEAIRRSLDDFGLLQPLTTDDLGAVPPPRTIVWLDDIDQYLRSGLTRVMLQALLHGPQPVIVLGTIWPSQYHSYMTLPRPGTPDTWQRERQALTLAEVIEVPGELSGTELSRAQAAAWQDTALAAALMSSADGVRPFQTLTARPHLVRRWSAAADTYAKALITAAVEVRRNGIRRPLTVDQLRDITAAHLTAAQRAKAPPDWFDRALAYATTPVQGGIATLTPVGANAEGDRPEGYRVSESLLEYPERRDSSIPSAVMDTADFPPGRPGFEDFFRASFRELVKTAMYAGAAWEEAEDAASATLTEMLGRWEEIRNPRSYARRAVVHNFIKDRTRKPDRIARRMIERTEVRAGEAAGGSQLTAWEDDEWVMELLRYLPSAQREVMALVVDGFSHAEIAMTLGKTSEAVRQNLLAARQRLSRALHDRTSD